MTRAAPPLQARRWSRSASTWTATSLASGAMTASLEPSATVSSGARAARARLLHRRPRQERHDGAVRDARAPPADLHARRQGAVVLRDRSCARACERRRRPSAARARSTDTWRCSPTPRREQRVGEASPSYLWSEHAAARIAELQPDARIIAILREPASFLRSLHLQLLQTHVETERDLRKAIALEAKAPGGQGRSAHARPAAGAALLRARPLCRAAAPLRATLFATRADAGADLRGLPRGQRGDGAPRAALPRRRRHARDRADSRPTRRSACAPQRTRRARAIAVLGRGPGARAREGERSRR